MDYVELNKIFDELIKGVPCKWGNISQDLDDNDFHIIRLWSLNKLSLLERLIMYTDMRGGSGKGDIGHEAALDATRE